MKQARTARKERGSKRKGGKSYMREGQGKWTEQASERAKEREREREREKERRKELEKLWDLVLEDSRSKLGIPNVYLALDVWLLLDEDSAVD